jgi:hypothetical protein
LLPAPPRYEHIQAKSHDVGGGLGGSDGGWRALPPAGFGFISFKPRLVAGGAGRRQSVQWLAIILALFAYHIFNPEPHFWRGFIISTMLLLNRLAFQFRWPGVLMIALRALALAWVIGGGILIFTV